MFVRAIARIFLLKEEVLGVCLANRASRGGFFIALDEIGVRSGLPSWSHIMGYRKHSRCKSVSKG